MPWILALIVAAGITVAVSVGEPGEQATNTQPSGNTANVNVATAPIETAKAPHPVSLPALVGYELTGRDLTIGEVLENAALYTRYFVTYKSDELTISGILNIPKGDGPFPVLFLNHGYIDRAIYTNGRGLKREQDYFARQGFAVLHSDYRCHAQSECDGSDEFTLRLGYVKDAMNAVQAVKTSTDPRLSKTDFGMLGHSMGGGIALNTMVTKPGLVNAYVLYAAVSGDLRDNFERWIISRPAEAQKIIDLYQTPESNPEFWNNLSPHQFFDNVTEPVHVFHGTVDASVPLAWSERTVSLLKAAGKQVQFTVYDGQPHEFSTSWSNFMQTSADFFRIYLIP